MKPNFFELARPERPSWSGTITDPAFPDKPFDIKLTAMGVLEQFRAGDLAEAKFAHYQEFPFPMDGVDLTLKLAHSCAALAIMAGDPWSFEDFAAMAATMETAYNTLSNIANSLTAKVTHQAGNASGAAST